MKSTPLLLIMLLSLSTAAQDITGKWTSYSTVWKGKEYPQNDKKQRITLILKKDSTYIKHYYEYEIPKDSSTLSFQYCFSSNVQNEKSVLRDSKGNALHQLKKVERGRYSIRKGTNEIQLDKPQMLMSEIPVKYTMEKGQLVLAISAEGIIKSPEKYMYIKFKLKKF